MSRSPDSRFSAAMLLRSLGRADDEIRSDLEAGPLRSDGVNRRMAPLFVAAILGFLAANAGSSLSVLKYATFALAGLVAAGSMLRWWGRLPRGIQALPIGLGMGMGSWIAFPDNIESLWARALASGIVLAATGSVFVVPWKRLPLWLQALPPMVGLVGVLIIQLFAASYFAFFPLTLLVLTFLALYYQPVWLRLTLGVVIVLTVAWVVAHGRSFSDVVIGALAITVLAIVSLRVSGTVGAAARALKTAERQAAELLRRTAELEVARAQAEAASRAKSDHLSRMSHELRTPMSAILGFADLLSMNAPRENQREEIEAIQRAGDHLARLIDDVLEVARIEAGKGELSLEPVSVGETIQRARRLLPLSEETDAASVNIFCQDVHEYVQADEQRLRQVLLNLLSNAVKYNRPGGTVNVRATARGGQVRIEVADTGFGIATELQDRLFQPFERLGAERTTIEGTGLGLALSKAWVEAMGGTIGVQSEVGAGTTFWVELTRAEAPASERRRGERDSGGARRRGAGRTVVYVADGSDSVDLVQTLLRQERPLIRLVVHERASDALQFLASSCPELILLDVHTSDLTGGEVLTRIRVMSHLAEVPVVILSADAHEPQRQELLAQGAADYLTKPFKITALLRVVDQALSAASSRESRVPAVASRPNERGLAGSGSTTGSARGEPPG